MVVRRRQAGQDAVVHRLLLVLVACATCTSACGTDESADPIASSTTTSLDAPAKDEFVQVAFQVKHPDGTPGTATIRYTDADGKEVTLVDVETPWTSKLFMFDPAAALRLTATSPDTESYLQCDGLTDQGPYGRTSGSSEKGRCEVDVTLERLGQREGD